MDSPPSTKMEPPPFPSTKMEEPSHRTESKAGPGGDDQQPLRRPMNAFLLFCKRHRRVVKTQHPWLDNRSCTKMLADMWSVLDSDEKNKYLQLARECKAAFMKAHPGYKWCGSSKNVKPTSPTVTTRTKLPLTPPAEGTPQVRLAGQDKMGNSRSHMGITLGKLADPSEMGGLSLLLLAGQQAMDKVPTTPPSSCETLSPVLSEEPSSEDPSSDNRSRLFEFAEMCSSRQLIESASKTTSKPATNVTPPSTPVLSDVKSKWTNKNSDSIKRDHPDSLDAANNNDPSQLGLEVKTMKKDKKSHKRSKKRAKGEKKKKKSSRKNSDESRVDQTKMKMEGIEINRVVEGRFVVMASEESSSMVRDGNINSSASYEDKCDGEPESPSGRRKSSRSCKGRLYREMVMGGMLESLQRPERPFNCKKPWRHGDSTCYSDGDDAVFEPEPEKPKRPSRRKSRKRTLSGCGISLPADFDYGEIDVEARLANLPQYSPDQFQPKGKCFRAKRSSSLYKNSTFVSRREGRDYRSYSNSEAGRLSCPTSPTQTMPHSPLTGSQRRKARKSSIVHLTPTLEYKNNTNGDENKSLALPLQDTYSQQVKSTRIRLEFSASSTGFIHDSNTKPVMKSSNSSLAQRDHCSSSVIHASREPRSASQKPYSSSRSTGASALKIGMQPTLTVP